MATIPLAIATRNRGSRNPIIRHSDALITLSDFATAFFNDMTEALGKVFKIPNFASLSLIAEDFKVEGGTWAFVGRLSEEKGVKELISYWPKGRKLSIAGDGELRGWLEAEIAENEDITYLGPLPKESVFKLLQESKGMIFSSTCRENAPMIYVESLLVGTPVVAYAANSVAATVDNEKTGVTFSEWRGLSEALTELEASRAVFSKNCLRLAETVYSPTGWYSEIEKVYSFAINRHKASN